MKLGYTTSCQKDARVLDKKQEKVKITRAEKTIVTSKRTQSAQVNKCEQLFVDFDRELSGMAITHTEGFLQITDISNIDESFFEGIKHQRSFMFKIHELMI